MDLESRGLPSGFVASTEFIQAADSQAATLGLKPASVFVPHPIQDRTNDEMKALAQTAIEDIVAMIVSNPQE
jgi:hypothetical protein